jgi:S1-C subfamily serine protease
MRTLKFLSSLAQAARRRGLSALLLSVMSAGLCQAQSALTPEARRDLELRPGVALVYIVLEGAFHGVDCKMAVSGTGFFYRPDGYLIPNGHVAQMANAKDEDALLEQKKAVIDGCLKELIEQRIHQRLNTQELLEVVGGTRTASALMVLLDNGKSYKGEIKAYSDPITSGGKDVAIIKVDANNLPTVPLGDSDAVNVNDHVYVIGYPGAAKVSNVSELVATSSEGIISAVKNKDYSSTPLLQTNANINHGNSGGPAFDSSGKAIGIATFGKSAPGFNFLVPISTAQEFVRQAGAPPERGAFDKTWHDALDAYASGDWTDAHRMLSDVLEMMPNQPEAQKLQLQAAANERAESPARRLVEKLGMPALAAIIGFIVIGVGVLLFLLFRKPHAKSPGGAAPVQAPPQAAPQGSRVEPALPASGRDQGFGSLHVSGGPLMGNRFPVTKAGLMIGRDPSKCSVVLPDDSIGREHAWVVPLDNGVAILDRNSSNGTYINSTESPRVNKVMLRHGDRIYLGKRTASVLTYYSE